jgi:large subunit ribosomal protein L3
MIGIIGKKVGMTQIFDAQGQQIPCTVVEARPNPVLMVREKATAGMAQIQLGYGEQRT